MTTAERLVEAFAIQRNGDLQTAESIYRSVLADEPADVNALQLLGLVCRATSRAAEGVSLLTAALEVRPDVAELHNNRGLCLLDQEQHFLAELDFLEALRRKADYPAAWNNLGIALRQQNRLEEAEEAFGKCLALNPLNVEALCNRGATLRKLRRLKDAETCCRQALALRPDYAEAENNLGMVLGDQQRIEEAEACFRRCIAAMPTPRTLCNLGHLLRETDRLEEAATVYQAALDLDPNNKEALRYVGYLYLNLGNFELAEKVCRKEIELVPALGLTRLAVILECRGESAEAEKYRQEALARDPECAEALLDVGLQRLLEGRWEEGWPLFENRWRLQLAVDQPSPQPRWDGGSLAGKTILLWTEQGQGDNIQFVRYAQQVKERGARVVLLCPSTLAAIFRSCPGVDQIVCPGDEMLPVDIQCPLMSLPGLFHTTPATVPGSVPYLTADPELQALWKSRLGGLTGYKVGLVWRGSWKYHYDRRRSVRLAELAPLANIPNVQLISLQKERGVEELAANGGALGIHDLGAEYQRGTFADTAALLTNLDLIISVDTAIAHLAGALAVPVWLANRRDSDWRWQLEGGRTPWYPTMRIFRQQRHGEWGPVFEMMARFLRHWAAQRVAGK